MYSELGTTWVSAGAEAFYLKRAFGKRTGFAFTWSLFLIIGSGACAAISLVLGRYVVSAFGFEGANEWIIKVKTHTHTHNLCHT